MVKAIRSTASDNETKDNEDDALCRVAINVLHRAQVEYWMYPYTNLKQQSAAAFLFGDNNKSLAFWVEIIEAVYPEYVNLKALRRKAVMLAINRWGIAPLQLPVNCATCAHAITNSEYTGDCRFVLANKGGPINNHKILNPVGYSAMELDAQGNCARFVKRFYMADKKRSAINKRNASKRANV